MAVLMGEYQHIIQPLLNQINTIAELSTTDIGYEDDPQAGNYFSFYAGRWIHGNSAHVDSSRNGHVRFTMFPFPNSLEYVVSCYTLIAGYYQGKGLSGPMMETKFELARMWGAKALIAQVAATNDQEIHILEKHGWRGMHAAPPNRTFCLYVKDLYEQPTDPNKLFGTPS